MNHIPKVQELERVHGVTWAELAQIEPGLNALLWQARAAGSRCRRWEDVKPVLAPFRDALVELVGFRANKGKQPILGSVGAYEVAYWRLHGAVAELLPPPSAEFQEARQAPADARSARQRELATNR
jgi:hypothetical protein